MTVDAETITRLQAAVQGQVLTAADAEYDDARRVWNGMIDRHPRLIVRAASASDVARTILFARRNDLEIAVLASTTSLFLTQNIELLTAEMRIYDQATAALVESNLAAEREIQQQRIDETVALAEKEYGLMQEARKP